jgi:hypothetical protein
MTTEPGTPELVVNVLTICGLLTLIACAKFKNRRPM